MCPRGLRLSSITCTRSGHMSRIGIMCMVHSLHCAGAMIEIANDDLLPRDDTREVAIVGVACRAPSCERYDRVWQLLHPSSGAISNVATPTDRSHAFDGAFFQISPREAERMDPRQHILLEVACEALDHAGIPLSRLRAGAPSSLRTGVYVGASGNGVASLLFGASSEADAIGEASAYDVTGTLLGVIAGRLSYALGFRGPCLSVDTTCSSSLVAIHLACRALREGDCDVALAGGVSLLPASTRERASYAALMRLSPRGFCAPFDAGADGVVGCDGCGMVVLKRLDVARAAGDTILATIRGSAINHDGRTQGLTVPSRAAQEDVLRHALADAAVAPEAVDFVECHGTATLLGDPIEADALGAVYGAGRAEPLILGALKGNIGHAGAAAGVLGLAKVVLAMEHETIPGNPNLATPSPQIDWRGARLQMAREALPWKRGPRARLAGVSAFGLSGTNAHLIIEEPPVVLPRTESMDRKTELVVLSAQSEQALRGVASRLETMLREDPVTPLSDVAFSLATTRTHHDARLAIVAPSTDALACSLASAARGETLAGMVRGGRPHVAPKIAWLFPGQGSQVVGMGRGLAAAWPAFREAFDAAVAALEPHLGVPLRDVIAADGERLAETEFTQPAMFAIGVGLAALWRSWGVEPAILLGHSVGELTAAHVAGIFSLEDAARLVGSRARLMQSMPRGAMVALAAPPELVREALAALGPRGASVSIAAINGPESTVVAGPETDLAALVEVLVPRRVRATRLPVSHAFHSAAVDAIADRLLVAARALTYRPPTIPIVSNVTGEVAGDALATPAYWVRHAREAVRFADGARTLRAAGVTHYLELGAKPTLLPFVDDPEHAAVRVASLRPGREEAEAVLEALGRLHVDGVDIRWRGVFAPDARRVALPMYPWQRDRRSCSAPSADGPLRCVSRASGVSVYEGTLSFASPRWSADHRVAPRRSASAASEGAPASEGVVLFPGAGLAELIRGAAADTLGGAVEVTSIAFPTPLRLDAERPSTVQVRVERSSGTHATVTLQSRRAFDDEGWATHATASAARLAADGASKETTSEQASLERLRARCPSRIDVAAAYASIAAAGLPYGPAFRAVRELWRGEDEALATVALPASVDDGDAYAMHPVLFDAALHAALLAFGGGDTIRVPFAIDQVVLRAPRLPRAFVAHVRVDRASPDDVRVDLILRGEDDAPLAEIVGVRTRPFAPAATSPAKPRAPRELYTLCWEAASAILPEVKLPSGGWTLVAPRGSAWASALASRLRAVGARCTELDPAGLASTVPTGNIVCLFEPCGDGEANGPDGPADAEGRGEGRTEVEALSRLTTDALSIVHSCSRAMAAKEGAPIRMWWAMRGACVPDCSKREVDDSGASRGRAAVVPAMAAIWGLGRTVRQEYPELGCVLVDAEAPPGSAEDAAAALLDELRAGSGSHSHHECEVARRGDRRFAARLAPAPAPAVPEGDNYGLEPSSTGNLDALGLVPTSRRAPEPGEVEIAIVAAGVNFRDVLNALGMFPGAAGRLGNECAGIVTRVGVGVTRVAVGDSVMAFGAGMFGRYVTLDARQVVVKPANLSPEDAAGVPLVFLTAWYALHDLAAVREGERVLVHAAAGGVGMAAVQIARILGAEILATASPPKWDALRAMGITEIGSSRDATFATTFGRTVDVVLDALAGDLVDAGLGVLRAGGRFLEMGKTDIRDPRAVAASYPDVHYRAFDLSEAGLDRIASMLDAIGAAFSDGTLRPLPRATYAITAAEEAFRFMAQARHVGKIVLTMPNNSRWRDGTVAITGGLGALGLHVASALVDEGVRHLVLLGRRGLETPGARAAVTRLEEKGAFVRVEAVDVTDGEALEGALSALDPAIPLRGVVHAAGVLDDGILADQTPTRFAGVLSAKVAGAIHLDRLTRASDLDFFVLFSSIAGTVGAPGQGAYAAANAYLDALATRRHEEGKTALSIAWGPWAEGGMMSTLDQVSRERLARRGVIALEPPRALALFASALVRPEPVLVVASLERSALRRTFGDDVPPLWRALVPPASGSRDTREPDGAPAGASSAAAEAWRAKLATAGPEERRDAIVEVVRVEIARVLSLGASEVDVDRPFGELGLDSLLAVELRNALARRLGITLHATVAFDHPTALSLAAFAVQSLGGREDTASGASTSAKSSSTDAPPDATSTSSPGGVDRVAAILAQIAALTEREQQTLADALFQKEAE